MLLCQINTIFVVERGVFDVSLSQGLRAGSELSGISLSSFVCRFGISLLYFLDSSMKVYRAPSCCIGWILSGQGVSLSQINTIFAVERGVFDVSLSRGLRAGSELSGISLSSFGGKFDLFFFITWIVRCKSLGEFVQWMGSLRANV